MSRRQLENLNFTRIVAGKANFALAGSRAEIISAIARAAAVCSSGYRTRKKNSPAAGKVTSSRTPSRSATAACAASMIAAPAAGHACPPPTCSTAPFVTGLGFISACTAANSHAGDTRGHPKIRTPAARFTRLPGPFAHTGIGRMTGS